jgi:serine O-acetyltransferase
VELLLDAGFLAVVLFRMSQALQGRGWRVCGKLIRRLNLAFCAADLNADADVGPGLLLPHPWGVAFGGGCTVGRNVTLYQGVSLGAKTVGLEDEQRVTEYPRIGDGVVLYPHVLVYGPVTVGDEAVVLGNSVVSSDVPAGATYGGIPAREIQCSRGFSARDLRSDVTAEQADPDAETGD